MTFARLGQTIGCAALALALALTGCAPAPSGASEPPAVSGAAPETPQTEETPGIEELLALSSGERITDPDVLRDLWDDYLHYTYMNLSNGYVGFDSVEELNVVQLASYLHIQMQRAGDVEGIDYSLRYQDDAEGRPMFGIPRTRLEEYCARYFGRSVPFMNPANTSRSKESFYDVEQDVFRFYPGTMLDHFVEQGTDYNEPDEWPNFWVNFAHRYPGGDWMIDTSYDTAVNLNGEVLNKKFWMKERDDGSLYFVGCYLFWPETHYLQPEGSFTELTARGDFSFYPVLAFGTQADTAVFEPGTSGRLTLLDFATGQTLREVLLPQNASVALQNEQILAVFEDGFSIWDVDLHPVAEGQWPREMARRLTAAVAETRSTSLLGSVKRSKDSSHAAFYDEEGVWICDLTTGKLTLVPGTEPYSPEHVVEGEAYRQVWLVDGGKKLFAARYGWEWTVGYLLYDIASGQSTYYAHGGGYGIGRVITDSAAYLAGHYDNTAGKSQQAMGPVMIDFATGETRPSDVGTEPENTADPPPWRDDGMRYSAFFELVDGRNIPGDGLLTQRLVIRENATGALRKTDFILTAPSGAERILGVSPHGSAYVWAEYLGERLLCRID